MGNWVQELLLKITGDASEGKKALKEVEEAVKGAFENPQGAIGNFGSLVKTEILGNMGQIGLVAGGAAIGLGVLVESLKEIAASARESAAKINDMKEVFGLAAPEASKLQFTFESAGGSIDGFTRMLFMMEQRMENSAKAFDKGLTAIGLTREAFDEMSKSQRILAISDGMRALEENTNKSAIAMELMGRMGRDQLPVLLKPLRELYDQQAQVAAITQKDAESAEQFELELNTLKATSSAAWRELGLGVSVFDELNKGWVKGKLAIANISLELLDLASAYGYVSAAFEVQMNLERNEMPKVSGDAALALENKKKKLEEYQHSADRTGMSIAEERYQEKLLTDQAEKSIEANKKRVAEEKKFSEALTDVLQTAMPTYDAINTMDGAVKEGATYYLQHGAAVEHVALMYGLTKAQVKAVAEQIKQTETVAKSFAVALVEVMKEIQKNLDEGLKFGNKALQTNLDAEVAARTAHVDRINRLSMDELSYQKSMIEQEQNAKKRALNEFGEHYQEALEAIDQETEDRMNDAAIKYQAAMDKMKKSTTELEDMVNGWLTSFPNLLQQAFTGGGGMEGAFKALTSKIGGDLGTNAFGNIASKLSNTFASKFGVGVTQALGSMIPGIGGVIGSLAGTLMDKLFHIGGPSKEELQGRDAEKQFESQFKNFDDMMAKVGEAYRATGRSSQQAEADVKRLMDAERQGGAAVKGVIDQINGAFNDQKQDTEDLQAAIKTYKFSIEELGPALQKQSLDEQAQKLINDWRVLVQAGVDQSTVNTHMADTMNQYLATAKKTGTEVPAAMQPILQKMIEQGTLVDENGNKITDMKDLGVTFSETMTQGFQKVVDKLGELIKKIGGDIPDAIAKVPKNFDINANVHPHWDLPPVGTEGLPSFAGRPMEAVTSPGLAMLHPGDLVGVPKPGMGGGGGQIVINAQGSYFKDRSSLMDLAQMVSDAQADLLRGQMPFGLRN